MRKLGLLMFLGGFMLLNPVLAQSNNLSLECGVSQESDSLQPGGEMNCNVQFPSSFNWNNYTYDWSVSQGDILQRSVESVSFQAPYNTSKSEIVLEASITDASGQDYSVEKIFSLETSSDSTESENDTNNTYEPPVEEPEENSSDKIDVMPDYEVNCGDTVEPGEKVNCSVSYSTSYQAESYEWSASGEGEIEGGRKTAVYTSPEDSRIAGDYHSVVISFSSPEWISESDTVKITSSDSNQDLEQEKTEEKIIRYQEKIAEQRQTIENQTKTIKDLREKVKGLRNRINEMEERKENQANNSERKEAETDDPEPVNKSSDIPSDEIKNDTEGVKENSSEERQDGSKTVENQTGSDQVNETGQPDKEEERSLLQAFTSLFN